MKLPVLKCLLMLSVCFLTPDNSQAQIVNYPYLENFDSGSGGWLVSTPSGTAWELGTPSVAGAPVPFSTPNCWGTDLDSGYRKSTVSYLTSPSFQISGLIHPCFSFRQYRAMSFGLDGMKVEYTTDGQNWLTLGTSASAGAVNWYNTTSIVATGQAAFTGVTGGAWIHSAFPLSSLGTPDSIRLRFVFTSNINFGSAQAGVFIDNVQLNDSLLSVNDVALLNITGPSNGIAAGTQVPITLSLQNNGAQTLNFVQAGYSVNGQVIHDSTYAVNVIPGGISSVSAGTFTVPTVNYSLCAWVIQAGSAITSNDTLCNSYSMTPSYTLPYSDDFESGNLGWTTSTVNTSSEWQSGLPAFGATAGAYSGNTAWDINLISAYAPNANATLTSPVFDLTNSGAGLMEFFLNYNTENNWDGTRLEYAINGSSIWQVLGTVNDPLGSNWYTAANLISSQLPAWEGASSGWIKSTYLLQPLTGQANVQFRFVFTSDGSVQVDGVSMDNFSIYELPDLDAGICGITSPSPLLLSGSSATTSFCLENKGQQTINSITCSYTINGVNAATETFLLNLPSFQSDTLTFNTPFIVPTGDYAVCIQINSADSNLINNFFCDSITSIQEFTLPYFNDFNAGSAGWGILNEGQTGTDWQLGAPAYGVTSGAYSAPSAWDINLTTPYGINANVALYTPVFNLSNTYDVKLRFRMNYETGTSGDGFRVDYRVVPGSNWMVLGTLNDPRALNWYTNSTLANSSTPGWSGNSAGWKGAEFPIDSLNLMGQSKIQFRWVFVSDAVNQISSGVSIDDVEVTTRFSHDAGIAGLENPADTALIGVPTPLKTRLKNFGISPLQNLQVSYVHNSGSVVTLNWSGTLLTDSTVILNLGNIIPVQGQNTLEIYTTWGPDQYPLNDTLRISYEGIIPPAIPYFADFETGTSGWSSNNLTGIGSVWQWGTPSFAPTSSSYSGLSCWDVNLTAPYANLSRSQLATPIFNTNGFNTLHMNFWLNYSTEINTDGSWLEFTTNGTNWSRLGSIGDMLGQNWYNSPLTQGNSGWSGNSNGWINCNYNLNALCGNSYLRFRFVFISDITLNGAGISLDDFSLSGTTGLPVQITEPSIYLYPNPALDIMYWTRAAAQGALRMELFSSAGQLQLRQEVSGIENQGFIDVSTFPAGIYQFILTNSESRIIHSSRACIVR